MGVHPRIGSEHDIHVSGVGGALSWLHDLDIVHTCICVYSCPPGYCVWPFFFLAFWLEIVKPSHRNGVIG